jgi:hypothetical protein
VRGSGKNGWETELGETLRKLLTAFVFYNTFGQNWRRSARWRKAAFEGQIKEESVWPKRQSAEQKKRNTWCYGVEGDLFCSGFVSLTWTQLDFGVRQVSPLVDPGRFVYSLVRPGPFESCGRRGCWSYEVGLDSTRA